MATQPPEVGRHPSLARLFAPTGALVRVEDDPTDMSDRTWWGGQLDRLAERVFSGPEGPARAAPLLARWDAQVGGLGGGDVDFALLQAARVDWALCDTAAPGGGPGESWAWRAAHGCVPGVEADAAVQALARSQVGLFEVWPGKPALLRGRIRGLCLRVDDPALTGLTAALGERGRIAALWELRIVFTRAGACLCRPPIAYPLEILPRLTRAHEQHWRDPQRGLDLMQLRRMRLLWTRSRRADVRAAFG